MLQKLFNLFKRKKKLKRIELVFVSFIDAEDLIKKGWVIAEEEHFNKQRGFVYLEKLEEIK